MARKRAEEQPGCVVGLDDQVAAPGALEEIAELQAARTGADHEVVDKGIVQVFGVPCTTVNPACARIGSNGDALELIAAIRKRDCARGTQSLPQVLDCSSL